MSPQSFFFTPITLLPAFFFVLLAHGLLISSLLSPTPQFRHHIRSHGLFILSGFFISLLVNLILIVTLSLFSISITDSIQILAVLDILLLILVILKRQDIVESLLILDSNTLERMLYVLCLLMFIIMMRNGGVIDILADGWWHMSLAERIIEEGTIFTDTQHLVGMPKGLHQFDYPFLWHSTLALISLVSGSPLPVIWHAIASFIIPISMIAYYYFAYSLTRSHLQALGATILFCMLYGGLNSYYRVGPWPGNVSYIGLYFCLYLFFKYAHHNNRFDRQDIPNPNYQLSTILSIFAVSAVIATLHGVALVLFLISIIIYIYGLITTSILCCKCGYNDDLKPLLRMLLVLSIVGFSLAYLLFPGHIHRASVLISSISPVFLLFMLSPIFVYSLFIFIKNDNKYWYGVAVIFFAMAGAAFYSFDLDHLRSLFYPQSVTSPEIPRAVENSSAVLPVWIHQLKGSLLFTGLLSVPLSIWLLVARKDRASVFVAFNAIVGFTALSSPDMFSMVRVAIQDTSAYRIHLLIFHPIIYSMAFYSLGKYIARK